MNVAIDWLASHEHAGELAVSGIHLTRGGRRILQDVSLRARPGRVLVLIGPNGAGKSSLINLFAGLLAPSMGAVTLDGQPLQRWSTHALARRRAMLSQHVQLGFSFLAEEVVHLGRSAHASAGGDSAERDIVDAAMRAAHAWHLRGRAYPELSGGEKQRVQLARVLAQVWDAPEAHPWLLLDEPEAGLDIAHQHFVLQRARVMATRGFGVIAVLHDLNLALRYADDVAVLSQGRLLRHGSPAHALDPEVLSTVYGLSLRRQRLDDGNWVLLPA
ncbi:MULTISPECIES: heme ABC transporter ATP-binding protein [Dyella]|uniref:Heme ABC transporter ATP-binding protein n=2 Tax=Dyella TaxID=231454 RepID=A0A4R0YLE9_9GAMM|nr:MULTISPECIES: heme ABC transporter ATP-binding protein [Dyella]TBR36651.1 heme ABC transporter ATP-binding protein [Dyella terrae]TCI08258.1 heme ABC transporter ATP-binding protein [Dyella soli]